MAKGDKDVWDKYIEDERKFWRTWRDEAATAKSFLKQTHEQYPFTHTHSHTKENMRNEGKSFLK